MLVGFTSLPMAQRAVAEVRLALAATTLADCRCLADLALADDAACACGLVRDDPPVR